MRVLQAILMSLAIHFFLALIVEEMPIPSSPHRYNVEVDFSQKPTKSPSQNEKPKEFARQAILPEKLKVQESDDKLRFLSEHHQRVKQQTKAALSGLTENRSNSSAESKKQASQKTVAASPNRRDSSLDAFGTMKGLNKGQRPTPGTNNQVLLERGFSTISESVDVAVGKITALNTDQYLFYSFFNRVGDLIYNRWEGQVKKAIPAATQKLAGHTYQTKWVTTVDIWVNKSGEYHSAHLMKESGLPEFDRAALVAFQQARFFPNPPQELVEDDGFIHLRYDLEVHFDPKAMVTR